MRIFLSGNEDVAKWHLPVAQSKVAAFADECRKSGLKQNRFTFLFKETGAMVEAQYAFGQVSMQIHAPFIPMVKAAEEEKVEEVFKPKTFWVSTTQGYFWVEVRYADGVPSVILTPFEAFAGEEFVYPGMATAAPGMIAGCFDDTPESRYVLAQNGAVLTGVDEEKGTIKSTEIINEYSRITVVENEFEQHDYVLMLSDDGKTAEMRRVHISFTEGDFVISRQYASIDMATEGETNLPVANLLPNPTWVHRKCSGSYFSPNKTIGYHVDIGTDDEFFGNIMAVAGPDLLDNSGGFEESMFNHTPDLYRIAGLLSFPVAINGSEIQVILVAPTMGFSGAAEDKCWGGYGLTQSWASCVDYMQDFNSWLLSPRPVLVTINLQSGTKLYRDFMSASSSSSIYEVTSWDGKFSGSVVIEAEYSCDTDFYSDMTAKDAADQCSWVGECEWSCGAYDPGSTGQCAKGWTPKNAWEYFSRENLRNSRRMYFLFGNVPPHPQDPKNINGFYLLFDGLWHLDIGVLWTTSRIEGNLCGLCSIPNANQNPGELVVFSLQGVDHSWVANHGHEYVENMEIVTPLGWVPWPTGGVTFGFVAKVPEEYAAPHDPVLMKGGITYTSEDVEGETIFCERAIMSTPCICEGNTMVLSPDSWLTTNNGGLLELDGGCPPFELSGDNVSFNNGKSYELTDRRQLALVSQDDCYVSITAKDACGTVVSMSDTYSVVGAITGPVNPGPGETAIYRHNLGPGAAYTGDLPGTTFEGSSGNGIVINIPDGDVHGTQYTISFDGICNSSASMDIYVSTVLEVGDIICVPEYSRYVRITGILNYWAPGGRSPCMTEYSIIFDGNPNFRFWQSGRLIEQITEWSCKYDWLQYGTWEFYGESTC